MKLKAFLFGVLSLSLISCTGLTPKPEKSDAAIEIPKLEKGSFSELPDWEKDDLKGAYEAFKASCKTLLKQPASRKFKPRGTVGDFHAPCRALNALKSPSTTTLRQFFEGHFQPFAVSVQSSNKREGLFTGYYEASLNGSLRRHGPYQVPLHAMPKDLYSADLGQWYPELAGKKITAQVKSGKLTRYPDHASIKHGGIDADTIVWVDDPADKFFLQIQGSGVVQLDTGGQMRVGYAGKNGHKYYAIGRALIERGALTKETVSLQTIRAWMARNPSKADELMNLNPSYVFFKRQSANGAIGAQGVVLTPKRSLAVDRHLYSYGMPVWLSAAHPKQDGKSINRLMIAQDTGGAIRGAVRGDFFWGFGETAEDFAGEMKSIGRYWMLLPK